MELSPADFKEKDQTELYCLQFPFFSTLYVILFLIFFSVFANERQRIQSGKLVTCYFKKGGSYVEKESLQCIARFDGGNDCNPLLRSACVFTGGGDNAGCL